MTLREDWKYRSERKEREGKKLSTPPKNLLMRCRNQKFQQAGNRTSEHVAQDTPNNFNNSNWIRAVLANFSWSRKHDRPNAPIEMLGSQSSESGLSGRVKAKETAVTALPKNSVASTDSTARKVLAEEDAYSVLGFSLSRTWKYVILSVIFFVQLSMNFNAAVYPNAIAGMQKEFGIENTEIMELGMGLFLICYAFGCELWAPWSEELGRFWVLQASLFLVNIWQFFGIYGTKYSHIVIGRVLGGFSSAGGSVTLGMIADMFEPDRHQFATLYVVLASCGGSVLGPIFGGIIEAKLDWRWVFKIQLIVGAVAQVAHALLVPETRSDVLLDREAQRRRKDGVNSNVLGPNENKGTIWQRISFKHVLEIMWRPYHFLLFEPIVGFLSLLSGFSDALIFLGLYSFGLVLDQWHFTVIEKGLSFISLLVGYFIAYIFFIPFYIRDSAAMDRAGGIQGIKPERRLLPLVCVVLLEPIGLGLFAAASLGPPVMHWFIVMLAACLIGIANFAIYQATIDYMVASYGGHAASATGGNGFCRDFLAGVMAFAGKPMYNNIMTGTKYQLVIPATILAGVGILLCLPVFAFWIWGPKIRARSPFACQLAEKRDAKKDVRAVAIAESRGNSPVTSRVQSRQPSPSNSRDNSPERKREASDAVSPLQSRNTSLAISPSPITSRKSSVAIYKTRSRAATASSSNSAGSTTLSKQPSIRLTTKGLSNDGKLGSSRIVDEAGEEIELSPKTSERKGRSMAMPNSPGGMLARVRSNSDTATAIAEEQMPSPMDAHFQNEQTLMCAFDVAVKRTSFGQ